ncbi:lipid II flippase MurJ [Nonomuraea longicatena]|uniref:Lipid II flippase MurJ n=1 Tax=Nonomuraea longicatena TaxID=83682 RepID=A0ABP3ZSZ5_9ACTN
MTVRERRELLVRATGLTAGLTVLGSGLGFTRDLFIAGIFGATASTDAFLVAWTVPETAAPLLIEGALAYLLIPLFSRAAADGTGLREVVSATLPRAATAFVLCSALTALCAPLLVSLLAPGVAEHDLAVACTRIASVTILAFGLAGYLSAALRTRQVYGSPAAIYVAYNVGIIAFAVLAHESLGIAGAAWGVAVGGLLMVAVQVPSFVRHVGLPRLGAAAVTLSVGAFAPIASFTLIRQSQVFVERFVGSSLPAGSISYLNYAQKIAQVPMVIALVVATVSFPVLAQAVADGDAPGAGRRVDADTVFAGALVLAATAFFLVFAPDVVRLLLEHGAFTAADTEATAWCMRVYCLGLLGHTLVGVLCRVFFCGPRPSWYPAVAMGAGLAVTTAAALALAPVLGVGGVALANAAGISLTAVLLSRRLDAGRDEPLPVLPARAMAASVGRLALAAAGAALAGALLRPCLTGLHPVLTVTCGASAVAVTFVLIAALTGARKEFMTMVRPR